MAICRRWRSPYLFFIPLLLVLPLLLTGEFSLSLSLSLAFPRFASLNPISSLNSSDFLTNHHLQFPIYIAGQSRRLHGEILPRNQIILFLVQPLAKACLIAFNAKVNHSIQCYFMYHLRVFSIALSFCFSGCDKVCFLIHLQEANTKLSSCPVNWYDCGLK